VSALGQCRIHVTTEHEEMHCLVFLLRVDFALQGRIYFVQVYDPMVLVNPEEDFAKFRKDITKKPKSEDGEDTWCSVHSLSHSKFR